ncbi:hypothetical protein DERP_001989 [Dermatophagoides pteronyssinus]|uniref:Uncharacterized protein n=1 Tax=Dermatophagoides pteronyssinus TaxID=6956 RepID=A0ABQ8JGG1_DERPT|nr:hypothetical protein DERP_001989 [Dermatophagoides pteronyssinus]
MNNNDDNFIIIINIIPIRFRIGQCRKCHILNWTFSTMVHENDPIILQCLRKPKYDITSFHTANGEHSHDLQREPVDGFFLITFDGEIGRSDGIGVDDAIGCGGGEDALSIDFPGCIVMAVLLFISLRLRFFSRPLCFLKLVLTCCPVEPSRPSIVVLMISIECFLSPLSNDKRFDFVDFRF